MKFYLGTHQPYFANRVNIPWFISIVRILKRNEKLQGQDWILDSGGFTQVGKLGEYQISEDEYLDSIALHQPNCAFCQDWMCEAHILEKTGLTVVEHQERTLESYLSLSKRSHRIRPVLQGWTPRQYAEHVTMYRKAGVDMGQLFGVGTVCSRNGNSSAIRKVLQSIHDAQSRIRLHGFGLKTTALMNWHIVSMLESADSMAWCRDGSNKKLCSWCPNKSCSNCLEYALLWRKKVLHGINRCEKQCLLEIEYR